MSEQGSKYIDVLLPLAIPNLYTYHFDPLKNPQIKAGGRVLVQFGKRKIYTALVVELHNRKPAAYDTKEIIDVLDENPIVQPFQLKLWQWMAQYYMCNTGEVFAAALPSGLKPESETKLFPGETIADEKDVSPQQYSILEQVYESPGINILTIESRLKKKGLLVQAKKLVEKGFLLFDETIKQKAKPKTAWYITLERDYQNNDRLQHLADKLERRAPKQNDILLTYLMLTKFPSLESNLTIARDELLLKANATPSNMKALVDKGIFKQEEKEISRLNENIDVVNEISELSEVQQQAFLQIKTGFREKEVALLHGVTSSGKTEIYIKLINEVITEGRQVLFLLPEIALTAQIIERLRRVFGDKVGVYHSKYSNAERVEVWNNVMGRTISGKEPYQVILGVRSSIFLPFKNLGLIIVDEEHENTFKQYDPAPRYHARDVAVVLAQLNNAKVLLGSATPSVESYQNALSGKYALVELKQRYRNIQLPEIYLIDTAKARKQKRMHDNFSQDLIDAIKETLANKHQVILFKNRRGYAQFIECADCGWVPYCVHCDVSMTYHKFTNRLVCHYCGYSQPKPDGCHACGSTSIETLGYGTERIEDTVKDLFPDIKVQRLDLDSTRNKTAHEKIILAFQKGEVDILIGTQMVTKGLDFENVMLVGVMNADSLLNFPDFRAFERSYQLLSQVGGRAGRKHGQGKVLIQTANPKHQVLKHVVENDFTQMFQDELSEREKFVYPPFFRLIRLTVKHRDKEKVNAVSKQLAVHYAQVNGLSVLGPQYPLVARTFNTYQKCIYIKFARESSQKKLKQYMHEINSKMLTSDLGKGVQLIVDVDPY